MTIISHSQLLAEIRDPESASSRVESLRILKNELIGHDQRKQVLIEDGIVPVLSDVLSSPLPKKQKSVTPQTVVEEEYSDRQTGVDGPDASHLQAVIIVSSLAQS